ncbi:MAG TPA: hypothetical protein VEW48_10805 [Thermoanaerobaculia bacterium]|nr:hypothetical protein [Thermoanaerobaculia bacterium]
MRRAIKESVSRLAAIVPLALLAMLALAAAAPQQQLASVQPVATALPSGVRVEFAQLNWLGEGGKAGFPQSRVGTAEFSFGPEAGPLVAGNGAFINVVTQVPGGTRSWAVRNLFVRYPSAAHMEGSHPSVQFSLTTPNGLRVSSLSYSLSVTASPLNAAPSSPLAFAPVALENYHTGGFNGGGSGLSLRPLTIGPWIGPAVIPRGPTATTDVPADGIPPVDEGTNGCAPGSVARSIAYMTGDEDAQDIYDDLYDDMGTTEEDGTQIDNIVKGKAAYAEANGLDITTDLNSDGIDSIGDAMDTLDKGGDVEILIGWDEGGGHAAMVTSITDNGDGTYTITYVDDPNQGDGKGENEEHTITVNADGSFDGGTVIGFITETLN